MNTFHFPIQWHNIHWGTFTNYISLFIYLFIHFFMLCIHGLRNTQSDLNDCLYYCIIYIYILYLIFYIYDWFYIYVLRSMEHTINYYYYYYFCITCRGYVLLNDMKGWLCMVYWKEGGEVDTAKFKEPKCIMKHWGMTKKKSIKKVTNMADI
jgi:hypothetical protein